MKEPILYRRRLIPEECIPLNGDRILYYDDQIIVTAWDAIHIKKDLHHGYSCYFLKAGYKVSRFYSAEHSLLYSYCDIVDYDLHEDGTLVVTDLLADVILYPDGKMKIVDLDELVQAREENLLSEQGLKKSLLSLNSLLEQIYAGNFHSLEAEIISRQDPIDLV